MQTSKLCGRRCPLQSWRLPSTEGSRPRHDLCWMPPSKLRSLERLAHPCRPIFLEQISDDLDMTVTTCEHGSCHAKLSAKSLSALASSSKMMTSTWPGKVVAIKAVRPSPHAKSRELLLRIKRLRENIKHVAPWNTVENHVA